MARSLTFKVDLCFMTGVAYLYRQYEKDIFTPLL